ncbi:MAG TPA: 3D domain-containing protein [Polyangiaceae bacterium]|nr:3D domain-containing protein [Polyangiaceae bacterium]
MRRLLPAATAASVTWAALVGCGTAGSTWIEQPLPGAAWPASGDYRKASLQSPGAAARSVRVIGSPQTEESPWVDEGPQSQAQGPGGRSLGSFRNTYYDFPSEAEYDGVGVALKDARCETIGEVPRTFFESLCVQGSGSLRSGATVSFAKRDCHCAEVCPRTQQRICFESLDPAMFPWGRGALGKAITPLLSVAVDSNVIPLGTALYVPELDGLPRDITGSSLHDGCFIAQDRGVRVKGKHLDVFTGQSSVTLLWNKLVPSNQGVTVVLDSPRCARAK